MSKYRHIATTSTEEEIKFLKTELYEARMTILHLMPEEARRILESFFLCKSLEERKMWEHDVTKKIIGLAKVLESNQGSYFSDRAYCPLCGEGSSSAYQEGFAVPEGLYRHLYGTGNVFRYAVMRAVTKLARDHWFDMFHAQDKAEAEQNEILKRQRESTETLYRIGPNTKPRLIDDISPWDTPRNPGEIGWAEQRLKDLGFVVTTVPAHHNTITMLYSGDIPNPSLRSFVEAHVNDRPFDPTTDEYHAQEFTQPIETTKNSPIYSMHGYHLGKKPYTAIEAYIRHYTNEGDLVLDPFCGSGGTALAALMNGRKAVAIDASPAATFISRFYLSQCDPDDLESRFGSMCSQVAGEMQYLYATICHRCGGPATIHYLIYSNVYECPRCGKEVSLFEASARKPSRCPHCETSITPYLGTRGCEPVAANFSCHGKCVPKRTTRSILGPPEEQAAFQRIDVPRIIEIENAPIQYPYPQQFMMNVEDPDVPWGDEWRPSRNFRRVADLFTTRNLRALAAFMHAAGDDDDMRAIITSGIFAVSRKAQHLSGGGGYIPGNWALPPMSKQRNVLESLTTVFRRTLKAKKALKRLLKFQEACISTQSAVSMKEIPSCSVDYIFTDPPYGGAIQYGELNFVWETWLGLNTEWRHDEIIVNNTRKKSLQDWADMMLSAIAECFRVLKPGRWLSLCYHDSSAGTWRHVQDIMAKAGFVPGDSDKALFIDTGSNTYNQRVTDKLVKRDLVINFRKPGNGEETKILQAQIQGANFEDLAQSIITGYLTKHPGSAKDRIYDHLVNALVRRGCMQDHDFEKLLRKVAQKDISENKWFLRNT